MQRPANGAATLSSGYHIDRFQKDDADARDRFLAEHGGGLDFLHTRRFLSHHGNRFADRSYIVRNGRRDIVGVLPAARDPDAPDVVVSHPGLSDAGLVGSRRLRDGDMLEAIASVADRMRESGARLLRYKPTPTIYRTQPREDDVYALHQLGARPARCDLGAALDLSMPAKTGQRRRRALRKAAAAGLGVSRGPALLDELWPLIPRTLAERVGAAPTHTLEELQSIRDLFPDNFDVIVVSGDAGPLAGLVLFLSRHVTRLQYIASSPDGYAHNAVDLAVDHCIGEERAKGRRFLDFGTSTLDAGRTLSDGVQAFKAGFGAGSIVQQTWELSLS